MGRRKLTPNITNPWPPAHPQYLGRAPAVIGHGQDKIQRAGVFAKVFKNVYKVVCCAAAAKDYNAVLAWGGGHFACSFAWKNDGRGSGRGLAAWWGDGALYILLLVWENRAKVGLQTGGVDCGKGAATFPFPYPPTGNLVWTRGGVVYP